VGPLVDLNLDFFPELIVVTFVSHQDVQKGLRIKSFKFEVSSFKGSERP
jgi:hypothetical protein